MIRYWQRDEMGWGGLWRIAFDILQFLLLFLSNLGLGCARFHRVGCGLMVLRVHGLLTASPLGQDSGPFLRECWYVLKAVFRDV